MHSDVVIRRLMVGEAETTEGADATPVHAPLLPTAYGLIPVQFGETENNTFVLVSYHLRIIRKRPAVGLAVRLDEDSSYKLGINMRLDAFELLGFRHGDDAFILI